VSDRILRLQHVQIRVPDLELCTAYYTEVLGLIETAHEENRVFLKCWDEHEHHSVVLRQAPTYGLDHMSFKVADLEDLDYYTERVEAEGIPVKRYGAGELGPGWGDAIRFEAPSGHTIELGFGMEKVGNMLPLFNPPPRPGNLVGIAPPRLDHIFVMAEDVGAATRFYCDVLEFRLTEQIVGNDGHQIATWMERSHTPHDLAIVTGPNGALHHFAFWLDDWNAVREAADTLAYNGVTIDVAPTRHGVTRGYTVYFFDPVGNRNEMFTGGYWVDPDFEPITWTEEEMGRAMFYYAREVNERFFTVHS
jgi:catechol 2,3-dioxygenase